MMTVFLKDKTFVMSEPLAKVLCDVARDSQKDKLAIVALIRDDYQEMRKDIFETREEMAQATEQYKLEGWTVVTTKGDI